MCHDNGHNSTSNLQLHSTLQSNKHAHTRVQSDLHKNLMKGASQVVLVVKNPPAMQEMQETWVWSLGWEDPLAEDMATHSSILTWRIPWTVEPSGLQFTGWQRARLDWATTLSFSLQRPRRTVLCKVICVISLQGSSSLRMPGHLSGCVYLA